MKNVVEFIILGASIILACYVVGTAWDAYKHSSNVQKEVTKQQSHFAEELTEYDLTMYEGKEVGGSDVVNFIRRNLGDYISTETAPVYIKVTTTVSENTYINGEYIEEINNFASTMYIKKDALFLCSITRDKNKVIVGVNYSQK